MTESIDVDALDERRKNMKCYPGHCEECAWDELCEELLTALHQQQEETQYQRKSATAFCKQSQEKNDEIARLTKIKDGDSAEFRRMDKALDEDSAENVRLKKYFLDAEHSIGDKNMEIERLRAAIKEADDVFAGALITKSEVDALSGLRKALDD